MSHVRWIVLPVLVGALAGSAATCPLYVDAVNGNDLNPGTPGLPVATVQRALALAPPGGDCTLEVAPGVYAGGWDIQPGIHIIGAGRDVVTVNVAPSSIGVRFVSNGTSISDRAKLVGMTFRGPASATWIDQRGGAEKNGQLHVIDCRAEGLGRAVVVAEGVARVGLIFNRSEIVDLDLDAIYADAFTTLTVGFYSSLLLRSSVRFDDDPTKFVYQCGGGFTAEQSTIVDSQIHLEYLGANVLVNLFATFRGSLFAGRGNMIIDDDFGIQSPLLDHCGFEPGTSVSYRGVTYATEAELNSLDRSVSNLVVAPGFLDRTGEDFHLAAGSACIEKGYSRAIHTDIDGEGELDGDSDGLPEPDIGFDEYSVRTKRLLRYSSMRSAAPPDPPLATVLPLDPIRDGYIDTLSSGGEELEDVLEDELRPFILYTLDGPGVLRIGISATRRLKFEF